MLSREGISGSQERRRQGEIHPNKGLKNSLKSLFLSSNLELSMGNQDSGKSLVWKREGETEPVMQGKPTARIVYGCFRSTGSETM